MLIILGREDYLGILCPPSDVYVRSFLCPFSFFNKTLCSAEAAAAWRWSGREEIPHAQWQMRSPSKMVKGANLCLESNPILARDTQRAQTNAVCTRTQGPHRDCDRNVFEHLPWRYWSAVDCDGQEPACSRPGYGISPLGGDRH